AMLSMLLNGDCLNQKAFLAMEQRLLNIWHGNGVSVVVGARESLVQGEGRQLVSFKITKGKCERH
ncbi:hypothetical protein QTN47_24355, partial [Danxiaibacter flavus]